MSRYKNASCPVCSNQFEENDDVVVCPECGAPYHRECFLKEGRCVYTQLHEKGESWQPPEPERPEGSFEENIPFKCPRCAAQNPVEGIFCQVCGSRLNDHEPLREPPKDSPYSAGPEPIPLNPFTTPFGGVDPEEEIDGVAAKDIAIYVGNMSYYFVPKFKAIFRKAKAANWNWCAFFFGFLYFFYRKMYALGSALLSLFILTMIPSFIISAEYLKEIYAGNLVISDALITSLQPVSNLVMIGRLLSLAVAILCGFLANKLYYKRSIRTIKEIRSQLSEKPTQYAVELSRKGRVNRTAVMVAVFVLMALYMAASFISAFSIIQTQL